MPELSPVSSLPYDFDNQHNTTFKRLYETIDQKQQPTSPPPDLLHDSDEDDEDSLSTPSLLLSPKQSYQPVSKPHSNRRKSVPHRSPSAVQDAIQASLFDKSVVFQLDPYYDFNSDIQCASKIICGQSLLSALRKKVVRARSLQQPPRISARRKRTVSMIEIPRSNVRRASVSSTTTSHEDQQQLPPPRELTPQWTNGQTYPYYPMEIEEDPMKRAKKSNTTTRRRQSSHGSTTSGRPSRVKGPCQACQEASDGCMRKAFDWPFPSSQTFNDKGKPFVYLCNKCGLRYNKSGGCVCRHCRWVFCKEEKRKALQHIDAMRRRRPDGHIDPNEDIEYFVCSPKYWACGKPWKVGWVLNNLDEDDDDDYILPQQQ